MSLSKMIAATAFGALTFSSSALAARGRSLSEEAHAPTTNTSSASCSVVSIGYSTVDNTEAIASVTADAAAYICNGETGKSAHSIAEATASAFALAVASASVECELKGNAEVRVDASSSAVAAANIWVAAYADAFAGAGDCDKCDAYAASYGYIEKEVFLKAVADAEIELAAYTSGDDHLVFKVLDYQTQLKKVVVTAFAEALAGAADLKNKDGCLAWANANGCLYEPHDPHATCFDCEAGAASIGTIKEIDAIATASAKAAAYSCGNTVSIAELEVSANALAEALAVAISFAYASCDVDEGGWACAYAGSEIEETAVAVASAHADLWAGAWTCENCDANAEAMADAIGSVLVKAATDAFAVVCSDGGHWTAYDLEVEVKAASLCAIAEASAVAISIAPHTCLAGGVVYAGATDATCPNPH